MSWRLSWVFRGKLLSVVCSAVQRIGGCAVLAVEGGKSGKSVTAVCIDT